MADPCLPLDTALLVALHPAFSSVAPAVEQGIQAWADKELKPAERKKAAKLIAGLDYQVLPFTVAPGLEWVANLLVACCLKWPWRGSGAVLYSHAALADMGYLSIQNGKSVIYTEDEVTSPDSRGSFFNLKMVPSILLNNGFERMYADIGPFKGGIKLRIEYSIQSFPSGHSGTYSLALLGQEGSARPALDILPKARLGSRGLLLDVQFEISRPEQIIRLSALAEEETVLAVYRTEYSNHTLVGVLQLTDLTAEMTPLRCLPILPGKLGSSVMRMNDAPSVPFPQDLIVAIAKSTGWYQSFCSIPALREALSELNPPILRMNLP